MGNFIIRRIAGMIPVLILISLASFSLLVLMPGCPFDHLRMADPDMPPEQIERIRAIHGYDQPFYLRYVRWLQALIVRGDLGFSRRYQIPVAELIGRNIPRTILLMGLSMGLAIIIAIPIGIFSATRQYSLLDHLGTGFAFFGFAVPNFWLGMLLMILFAVHLRWLPAAGMRSVGFELEGWALIADRARFLILPVITLATAMMAAWMRYMRSSMLEVLHQDYIRTARAKGLDERLIIYKHGLRNALMTMITLIALAIPGLFSGAILTEAVFAFPGMGRAFWHALVARDTFPVIAIIMMLATLTIVFNLIADILYAFADPRVRYD
ncbi:ABC transporter permease [Candidatus Bipolaricaulota bacterium]|nr:ABC transporter permease [Candidatus Bipolaricaulota bacterium]HBR10349.1 diguanylate cyclase [Candidatus Acetothermia bacterium]